MATSAATHPLLMATTEPTRLERTASATNGIVTPGADQTRQEQPSKPRPRKMAKQHPPKKQPQRGMGVAQLERLRLQDQERWTKMPEVPPQPYPPYFLPHSNPQRPGFSFPGPLDAASGVPVQQYSAPPTRPPPPVSTGLGLGLGLGMGRGFLVQSKDDGGGDHGRLVPASVPGRVMFDVFGAGAPAGRGRSSKAVETSRELSSIPNAQQCVSDRCDVCLKKKRMDSQNAGLFINRARENYPDRMRVGNCDFLGLNLEIPQSKAAARTPVYTTHNLDDDDQNVEVTAIKRRVNMSGAGVSMEYEFFPGKSGRSSWTEGLNFPAGEEVAADADASEDGGEASNPIDLSLKLSC